MPAASTPDQKASFKEYINYYLSRKAWSQNRLSICARLEQSRVNKIINGAIYNIDIDVLVCICLALQLSVAESIDLLSRVERAFSPASDYHNAYIELIDIYAHMPPVYAEDINMLNFADNFLMERNVPALPNIYKHSK